LSFEASIDALTADSRRWDDSADMLATAAKTVGGMRLGPDVFGFAGGNAYEAYESIRSYTEEYLQKGSHETSGAAAALRQVRDTYEGSDEEAKQKFASKWKPH